MAMVKGFKGFTKLENQAARAFMLLPFSGIHMTWTEYATYVWLLETIVNEYGAIKIDPLGVVRCFLPERVKYTEVVCDCG